MTAIELFDFGNGCFELFGAFAVWSNVRRLWIDKQVKGIDWKNIAFYWSWGIWNCFYYPFLGQTFSFIAGIFLALGNSVWVLSYIKMRWVDRTLIQ